ncbi:HSF-type DNA-binding-domain-containing protein [Naematelia encephala]|uniref:HSF-type DNA-binding-domain-containing protein n=1 Tax=Naematelia encephala TaxID=71784 RepID=A0A1Y2B5M8_9TREE|nr:HSF-type DNA-binding-domain-containing protein [Naematelia encephala]
MDASHPLLPGPRDSTGGFLPSSPRPHPQAFAARSRWVTETPLPEPRAQYISPDPSPTTPPYPTGAKDRSNDADHMRYPASMPEFYDRLQRRTMGGVPMARSSPMWASGVREMDPYFNPPYVAPPKQQRRHNKPKKSDGKQPTFLTKLYSILDQPEYHHIIRWDEAGEVIVIEKPEELADKILPLVYKQSRFASFSRQLNIYGFMRKVSLRHVDRGIVDPDASTWSHPFLRRDSTHADIIGFKRRVPPRPSQSRRRASMIEESHSVSSGSDGEYHGASPPDAYHHHIFGDQLDQKPIFHSHVPMHPARTDSSPKNDYPARHPTRSMPVPLSGNESHAVFRSYTDSVVPSLLPQTAPPNASSFPTSLRIHQGHIRTRSVQGEPPSAGFSPSSPLAQPSWLPEPADPAFRGYGEGAPTYDVSDASTWSRRGYIDMNDYSPQLSRLDMQPSSLPSDFAPIPPVQQHQSPEILPRMFASALSDDSPTTVSPGVYQAGFSLPAYRPMQIPASPPSPSASGPTLARPAKLHSHRGGPSGRQERRSSVSFSPYSPRTRIVPSSLLVHHEAEGAGGRGGGGGDDEGLPSASLHGFHPKHPFEGLIEEGEVANVQIP